MRNHSTVLVVLLAIACSRAPSEVFVPGPDFHQTIQLSTAPGERAAVGPDKPLVLHAQRSTGPWVKAARSELPADSCWLASPPPDPEPEVADNLTWLVDPSGMATFNIGIRPDHTREVRFSRPGVYRLSAQSAVWCTPRYGGNTVTVEVAAPARLLGLERLYFDHAANPGEELRTSRDVATLLPRFLPKPEFAATGSKAADPVGAFFVRDFELPFRSSDHPVWVREVANASQPRTAELWWALYDGGRRSDVWYFIADPERTDRKMLTNYRLDGVSMLANDRMAFRVQGEMFRPGGAWWIVGKEFVFSVRDKTITPAHVTNVFGCFNSVDADGSDGVLTVATEREADNGFETRTRARVSPAQATACGFQDPASTEEWEFSWNKLSRVAQCMTSHRGAVAERRDLEEVSFVEKAESSPRR